MPFWGTNLNILRLFMSPLRSTLTKRGRSMLRGHTISLRPKPLQSKAPAAPPPFELAYMSSWELKVYYYLKKRNIPFTEQVSYEGGRGILGGMAVDFVLFELGLVLRVMGPWHTFDNARSRDEMQRIYLSGRGFNVVDLWEADLDNLDAALAQTLGVPIRAPARRR